MRKVWARFSALGLLAAVIFWQGNVPAQNADDYWSKIRVADAGPKAIQIVWKCIYAQQPHATMDADKYIALNVKEWRQQGKTEAEIKQLSAMARQGLLDSQQGHQQTSLVFLVHQGPTTRAAVTDGLRHPVGAPDNPLSSQPDFIDYYDGKNVIGLDRPVHLAGEPADKFMMTGSLKRDGNDIMPHVGMGMLPFLVGTPLFTDYAPANSSLQDGADNTIILEQRVQQHWGEQLVPLLTRWVISKQTWRPLLMEKRFDFAATKDVPVNQNALRRVRFLNYHQYPDGIWWPSHIIDERLGGRSPDEKPGMIYDYQLETAKFNSDVELTLLQEPLPVGSQVVDDRFGPGQTVSYVSKGNILSDAEVRKLLQEQDGRPPQNGQAMSIYR